MKIKSTWHLPDHQQAARRTKDAVETIDGLQISDHQSHLGNGQRYYISTYG